MNRARRETIVKSPKSAFISIFFAAAILMPRLSPASDESATLAKLTIQEGVATIICSDHNMIKLARLDYHACLAKSKLVAPGCWEGMHRLLPDLRLGRRNFGGAENDERNRSIVFVLEKCIQASILLSGAEHDGSRQADVGESNTGINGQLGAEDNESQTGRLWSSFIANAGAEYAKNRLVLDQIADGLAAQDLLLVTRDSQANVSVYKMGKDGVPVFVAGKSQFWAENLTNANVQSATETSAGVVFSVGSNMITREHTLWVTYVPAQESPLPECQPDFRRISCGSCEIDHSEDHRVLLTWFSREAMLTQSREISDANDTERSQKPNVMEQCWHDGMAQLGADPDAHSLQFRPGNTANR